MAAESHPFPSRTRPLSPPAPMVLGGRPPGRVGRRRIALEGAPSPQWGRSFAFRPPSPGPPALGDGRHAVVVDGWRGRGTARGGQLVGPGHAAGSSAPLARTAEDGGPNGRAPESGTRRPPASAVIDLARDRLAVATISRQKLDWRGLARASPVARRAAGLLVAAAAGRRLGASRWSAGPSGSVPLCRIVLLLGRRALRAAAPNRRDRRAQGGRAPPAAARAGMVGEPALRARGPGARVPRGLRRRDRAGPGRVHRGPVRRGRAGRGPAPRGPVRRGPPRQGPARRARAHRGRAGPGRVHRGPVRRGPARQGPAHRARAHRDRAGPGPAPRGPVRRGRLAKVQLAGLRRTAVRLAPQQLGRPAAVGILGRCSLRLGRSDVARPATQARRRPELGPTARRFERQPRSEGQRALWCRRASGRQSPGKRLGIPSRPPGRPVVGRRQRSATIRSRPVCTLGSASPAGRRAAWSGWPSPGPGLERRAASRRFASHAPRRGARPS